MSTPNIEPIGPGIAPELDILINADADANVHRARRGSSFQLKLSRDVVVNITGNAARYDASSFRIPAEEAALTVTVFIQLDRDLPPMRRRRIKENVKSLCLRVRWKGENATAQVVKEKIAALRDMSGVAYVETGQTLSAPAPLGAATGKPPSAMYRDIPDPENRHRYGQGVLVGIIDIGGFDFAHRDFLDQHGRTRWVAIWDQSADGDGRRPPPRLRTLGRRTDKDALSYGSEILKTHMNAAIRASRDPQWSVPATTLEPQSQLIIGSHGTHVASIAAGNTGVARRAHLAGVLVTLDDPQSPWTNIYDSTRIADAIEYLLDQASHLAADGEPPLPVSINISLGTNGHAHDSSSPVDRWIEDALATRGRCVTVAAGNTGQTQPVDLGDAGYLAGRIHAAGTLAAAGLSHELGWVVGQGGIDDYSDNQMQIWYRPQDRLGVELRAPDGSTSGIVTPDNRIRDWELNGGTLVSIYSETYLPANGLNRISLLLAAPRGGNGVLSRPIMPGQWRIRLTGITIRDGRYDAWIERDDPSPMAEYPDRWRYPSFLAEGSYTDDRTVNSLACTASVLSVANVDTERGAVHPSSSRGPTRDGGCKPDIAADGTNVIAARALDADDPWMTMTGTSMASPYVCGVAALMLAIHPTLTASQISGIMATTAIPLVGHAYPWRNDTGFGLINAADCLTKTVEYADTVNRSARDQVNADGFREPAQTS